MEQYEINNQKEGKEDLLNLYKLQFDNGDKQSFGSYLGTNRMNMMTPIVIMYIPMMPLSGFGGYGRNMLGGDELYGNRNKNMQEGLYNNSLADLLHYNPKERQKDKPLLKELEDGNYIVNKSFIEELANKYETNKSNNEINEKEN